MTINEEIRDRTIRHAHYFERYKTHEAEKIVKLLDKTLFKDLLTKIRYDLSKLEEGAVILTPFQRRRLAKLTLIYADMLKDGYKRMGSELHSTMVYTAVSEAEWQLKMLNDEIPLEYDFIKPS